MSAVSGDVKLCCHPVMQHAGGGYHGVQVSGCYIANIEFADDLAVLREGLTTSQGALKRLNESTSEFSLENNTTETEMSRTMETHANRALHLKGQTEVVPNFKFLSLTMLPNGQTADDAEWRTAAPPTAFLQNWWRNEISFIIKLSIFNAAIEPVLLYDRKT